MRRWRPFSPGDALVALSDGAAAGGSLPRHALPDGVQILGGVHVAGIDICAGTRKPSGLLRTERVHDSLLPVQPPSFGSPATQSRCVCTYIVVCYFDRRFAMVDPRTEDCFGPAGYLDGSAVTWTKSCSTSLNQAETRERRSSARTPSLLQVLHGFGQPLRVGEGRAARHVRVAAPRVQRQRLRCVCDAGLNRPRHRAVCILTQVVGASRA